MESLAIPDVCGVIILPNSALFPNSGMPLNVFEPQYIELIEKALEEDCIFCIGEASSDLQASGEAGESDYRACNKVGTAGLIRMARRNPDGTYHVLLQGVIRVAFEEWVEADEVSFPLAKISPLPDVPVLGFQAEVLNKSLCESAEPAISSMPDVLKHTLRQMMDNIDDLGVLTDLLAQQLVHDPSFRHELMMEPDVEVRVQTLIEYLDLGVA